MRHPIGVKAPAIIGGLLILLMMAAGSCVGSEPKAAEGTIVPPPSPTDRVVPVPTNTTAPPPARTPVRTNIASPPPNTPTRMSIPTATASSSLRDFKNGRWLEQEDPELASSINELGWIQDGIDDTESEAIQDLLYLAVESREVASSVVSLDWVQDGIEDLEASAIEWMSNVDDGVVASSVVALGWMQDGVDDVEVKTIEQLSYIANKDSEVGLSVVSLGWVQDGIDDLEAEAIDWMSNVDDGVVASSVVALGWMQDGVDDVEVKTIEQLSYIGNKDTEVGLSVVSLGWVQDGIDDLEADAIENVYYIAYEDAEVASLVVSLGWAQDDINGTEYALLEDIASIADKDTEAALRIVGMSFIETIEPPDVSAMTSLRQLAAFEPETFKSVMSHPSLRDGISNDLAPVVAVLKGVAKTNPALISVLLDPNRVLLEQHTTTLPLSGDVVLFIIRTAPGAARSMALLERSVRSVEEYMGTALPTNYVGLLYENAVSGSFAGTNFGTHIAILPKYDIDDGSHEAEFAGSNIAHEVAHYYWSGNADWVDEGAADLMASISEEARTGHPVGVTNRPCAHAGNIAELESLGIAQGGIEFDCNYSLGERIFVDLHRTLGDARFQHGFRELYIVSEVEDGADDYSGTSVGIGHVREGFRSDDGAANTVIARWYDGTEPYDLSRLDTGPVDPRLPGINGRIDEAYVITTEDGPAVSGFSAQDVTDWVYLTLESSYSVSGGTHEVPLEIVEYYEDGFEFDRRSAKLTAEAQYIGGTDWFSVGSPPSRKWALGRYMVYVYAEERKVAEVEYEVTP